MANENVGGTEGQTSVADASTANPETASTNDVLATLRHDPFPGGEAPKGKGATAKASTGTKDDNSVTPPKAKAKDTPEGQGDPSQPGKQTPTPDPEKDALKESLKHATDLLSEYKEVRGLREDQGRQPAGGQGKQPAQDSEPTYDFNIPDQLVQALTSDKPEDFKKGLQGFAKGIGLGVHAQVKKMLEPMLTEMLKTQAPQFIGPALEQYNQRKGIFDDFYGTYKELNNPKLYNVIAQTTQEVMSELKTNAWSSHVRDLVAKRVKEMLAGYAGGGVVPQAKPTGAQPPAMFGGNNSRQGVQTQDATEKDIVETLFGG